jgi:4-amino-4-deoxy-L-arabinose transferase-like glycosyltransferase
MAYFRSLKRNYWVVLVAVAIGVGIGLRLFEYSENLVFQSDQSRDALIVAKAIDNGAAELPLLGPQARGSSLQLGPFFYYLQFVSAKIFGMRPESLAYPDLLWGVFTLPLLFFLLKRLVAAPTAVFLTALASVSPFLVSFSRFAWNPNSLPFFTTAFALSFIKALEEKGRPRWVFLAIASAAFGMLTHLHFVALIGLAGGLVLFLLWRRPLSWRELVFCASIVVLFQVPLLANEFQTGGATAQAFAETVEEKGSQDNKHNLAEKTFRAYQELSRIVWLSATGQQNTDMIITRGFDIKCDKKCESLLPYSLMAMVLTAWVVYASWMRFRATPEGSVKELQRLLGVWVISFCVVTVLVAYQISTRFYLGVIPALFAGLGFATEQLWNRCSGAVVRRVLMGMGIALLGLNIWSTTDYLRELSVSRVSAQESERDLVFATEAKVTLGQLRLLARETARRLDKTQPMLVSGESRYARSLFYLLSREEGLRGCYVKGDAERRAEIQRVHIVKHKPEGELDVQRGEKYVSFGTLGLILTPLEKASDSTGVVSDCLDY